jgi:hypothetical protein
MKDRVYLTLAFIGFVILAIVVVNNYDITQDQKEFGVNTYYVPSTVKSKTDSSIDLAEQMQGSRKLTCPQVDMVKTSATTFNLSTLYGNLYQNAFGAKTMFVTAAAVGADTLNLANGSSATEIVNVLNVQQAAKFRDTKGSVRLGDIWDLSDIEYIELIAPFNFLFGSVNTTDGSKIVIMNTSGTCRITFNNVANWYCAGTVGTTQTTTSGKSDGNVTSWEDHLNNHHTVIGSTSNAKVSGGSVKDVIGYATADTEVLIEKYSSNSWESITLYEFVSSSTVK